MEKIKVYNIKEMVENKTINGQQYTTHLVHEIAILTGSRGYLILDKNGNETVYGIKDKINLSLDIKNNSRIASIFPDASIEISINEIINNCDYIEKFINEFIKNFSIVLNCKLFLYLGIANQIGIDFNDYCEM